jgi:hypothetical protein
MELLLKARLEGMTKPNIKAGFRLTGIEPFDRHIINRHSLPTLPPPPEVHPQLSLATSSLTQTVLHEMSPNLDRGKRCHIEDLAARAEQLEAHNTVVEGELKKYQEVNAQPARAGATVTHLETHHFSQPRVLDVLRERETATNQQKAAKLARDDAKQLETLQARIASRQAS